MYGFISPVRPLRLVNRGYAHLTQNLDGLRVGPGNLANNFVHLGNRQFNTKTAALSRFKQR